MPEEKEVISYTAYIQKTSLDIEANSIEEAWDKLEAFFNPLKEKGLYIEDIDIIENK